MQTESKLDCPTLTRSAYHIQLIRLRLITRGVRIPIRLTLMTEAEQLTTAARWMASYEPEATMSMPSAITTSQSLPFYNALARNYTSFDRYFCSILAGTFPQPHVPACSSN